ncbi:MAG: hypothetical protein JNM82_07260 [Rhodocyclaceae bacterium]|nr:hypothetical protein [Rhodocyclaceae bacterium]
MEALRLRQPLIALLLALLLLGAQQAAVAHLAGHAAGTAAAVQGLADPPGGEGDGGDGGDHGAGLAQLCTTCLAFAALDGAAAAPVHLLDLAAAQSAAPGYPAAEPPSLPLRLPHRARAPPAIS